MYVARGSSVHKSTAGDVIFRACRALSASATLWLVLGALPAGAQPAEPAPAATTPELPLAEVVRVDAGATCLETERLTLRVARWRERDTVDSRIRVEVRGDDSAPTRVSFVVRMQGGPSAERTLSDAPSDCDQFHSAVALAVAVAIDSTLTDARAQAEAKLPVPEAPPKPEPAPLLSSAKPLSEPPPKQAAHEPLHIDFGLSLGAAARLLRTTTFAVAPRLWVAPKPWLALSATGLLTFASEQSVGTAPGQVSSTLAAFGAEACVGGEALSEVEAFACLGGRLGPLRHTGQGFTMSFAKTNLWAAASGALQLRLWLDESMAIALSSEAFVPLAKYVILVDGVRGQVDQSVDLPAFGFDALLGPVFRFF